MLSIPYYLRERIPSCSSVDVEAIAFVSAMYDFRMRVPLLRTRFTILIDTLAEDNLKLRELTDPEIDGQVVSRVLKKTSYFHNLDPHGEAFPWLLRVVYDEDLEEKIKNSLEPDLELNKVIWRKLREYKDRGLMPEYAWKRLAKKNFLPKPSSRSPLKRINLFLRWIARDEYPDLGLWSSIDKKKLKVPLGKEISRTAGRVFYGKEEIEIDRKHMYRLTRKLAEINPEDPIKYDFVLSRPQILGICLKKLMYSHCSVCPLRTLCRVYRSGRFNIYENPLYGMVKEYIEDKRIRRLKEKHDLIVKRTIEYLISEGFLSRDIILRSDYVIDHGLRPDIFYVNNALVLGEVKTESKYIQGPQQLRVYLDELVSQSISRDERIGVLSYGRVFEGDLELIRENIELLRLDKGFNEIYILDFHGNPLGEPRITTIT